MSEIEPFDQTPATVSDLATRVAAAQAHADQLADRSVEIDVTDLTPEQRRYALNTLRADMDAARDELTAATGALQDAFAAQLEAARSALKPLQAKAAQLIEAVEAISLYLGSDEQIVLLRDGEPAPAATPITVYQTVLFMDEEMALAAEAAGLRDATIEPDQAGWDRFDAWLLADQAYLDQVCPAQRGVVALRSAREQRRNLDQHGGDGSEITHFLVRNGDMVAWVIASTDFGVGNRLVPARDEFDKFFYDQFSRGPNGTKQKLRPGTPAWDRAQESADRTHRHFLKIALILQGLVDRSTLLSPLPAANVSFTGVESYDDGHIIVVVDDDGSTLPSGVIPFTEWHHMIRSELEVGQRVVLGSVPYNVLSGRDGGPAALHPRTADGPPRGVPLVVKRRSNPSVYGRLSVSWRRTDHVWRELPVEGRPGWVSDQYVPSEGYASLTFNGDEQWVMPIDHPAVTIELLEWYLLSRENRRQFRTMIPVVRSALTVLRAEATAEAPFRALLAAEVVSRHGTDDTTAARLVDDAVSWWKTKKRQHRALVAGDDTDTVAYHQILAEIARRHTLSEMVDDPKIVATITATVPDAMWVGRRPDGTYVALVPETDENTYVAVHTWSAKRGVASEPARWVLAPDTRGYKTIRTTDRHRS